MKTLAQIIALSVLIGLCVCSGVYIVISSHEKPSGSSTTPSVPQSDTDHTLLWTDHYLVHLSQTELDHMEDPIDRARMSLVLAFFTKRMNDDEKLYGKLVLKFGEPTP